MPDPREHSSLSHAIVTLVATELLNRFPEFHDPDEPLNGGDAVDRLGIWLSELGSQVDLASLDPSGGLGEDTRHACIERVRKLHGSFDVSVEDNARVSVCDGVVHVQAWIALTDDPLPEQALEAVGPITDT